MLLPLSGCGPQPTYNGSVKATITNGQMSYIEFSLPSGGLLRTRADADRLIDQVEKVVGEMKVLRDQMPVVEQK